MSCAKCSSPTDGIYCPSCIEATTWSATETPSCGHPECDDGWCHVAYTDADPIADRLRAERGQAA